MHPKKSSLCIKMSPVLLSFFLATFFLAADSKSSSSNDQNCEIDQHHVIGSIGAVIDQTSRIGKEQKIAMEMAVHDFHQLIKCSKLDLHFQDFQGNSARAVFAVIDLVKNKQSQVILGELTLQEIAMVWEFDKMTKDIPVISLTPSMAPPSLLPVQPPSFIRMSYDMTVQMQCLAAIVGHFKWRKVIAIYERGSTFSADSTHITHLSDSLKAAESSIEYHSSFPSMNSLSNPEHFIEKELKKLRNKNVKVFTVLQSSLEFGIVLFNKAKELGMMTKGYAWIVSDEFSNLLDSIESSVIYNMEGVIGFKTYYPSTTESFKAFERTFKRKYRLNHPEEENFSSPSIYALRAYDATWTIAKAIQNSEGKVNSSSTLIKNILTNNFEGLSGEIISFKNSVLVQNPMFQIVNVIGRSYREMAFWKPQMGFFEDLNESNMRIGNGLVGNLGSIYWPGGELKVPKGEIFGSLEKPLRIGVPAKGAFPIFVNVTYSGNEESISGFSIEVFEAVVERLPYQLIYTLVPHYGTYDEMVLRVKNKSLDAAVGDTEIMAARFEIADFTQPYMESGLVMVVTVKPDVTKTRLTGLKAFTLKMWILIASMNVATGVVIWVNEHVDENPDFSGPFSKKIGSMLWFSVTILSFAQRESIRHNLSRLLMSTWLFVSVIITACFTAAVTTMMTVPNLEPSIVDVDYLLSTNSPVGCNGNSFIVRYLIDVLNFKPKNIQSIGSIHEYPEAFKNGDIKAAFFVAPHARIFLAEYCNGYTIAGQTYKLGGFGFVFPKGSFLANDISEAILKITQSGAMNQLEKRLSSFSNCSLTKGSHDGGPGEFDIGPFFLLFLITGFLLAITLINSMAQIIRRQSIQEFIQESLGRRRICSWASLILIRWWTKSRELFRNPIYCRSNNIINETRGEMEVTSKAIELSTSMNMYI